MIGIFRTSTYPRDGLIFGNRIASLLLLKLPSSLHRPSATTFSVPSFYDRHTLFNTLIYSTKLHSNIASLRNILYISGDRLFQFSSQKKKNGCLVFKGRGTSLSAPNSDDYNN